MDVDGYKVSGHEVAAWEGSVVVVDSSLFDLVATGRWCTKPAGSVPSVVMYSMRRGPCICVMDCVFGVSFVPHANHATRSRLPLHSRAVTIFLIDLLFGVSYLFLHVLYRRLDTFFSDCDDSFFAKRGGCGGAGLRSAVGL